MRSRPISTISLVYIAGRWWSADPWHNAAPVVISDVRYYTNYLEEEDILGKRG